MKLKNKVYEIVSKIPFGHVTTYGDIGRKIGSKGYRAIGQILHTNPTWPKVPCHRVVMKDGSVASNYGGGGPNIHKKRLTDEGVQFNGNKVNLEKHKIVVS